jgi:hypothetical protein
LSQRARDYLASLGLLEQRSDREIADLIWLHALAIGYSRLYLKENADGIRGNWPRIPLPITAELLLHSVALGREVAALLDTEVPVNGVDSGNIPNSLNTIAVIRSQGGGPLKQSEFMLTAGWGIVGKANATMPGKGKVETRPPTPGELVGALKGEETLDIYLNDTAYWMNVPKPVWEFTIGGYQVIKKWLSYRERRILNRALTMAEIIEVTSIARRLAALVLLQPQLDKNYTAVKVNTYAFNPDLLKQAPAISE